MALLEKCSEIRGEIRKCLVCGKLKGDGEFMGRRHKICVECKCAELSWKRGRGERSRKVDREYPVEVEPATLAEPQPVMEVTKEPSRPTGRPPLLRIPKLGELPPRWV